MSLLQQDRPKGSQQIPVSKPHTSPLCPANATQLLPPSLHFLTCLNCVHSFIHSFVRSFGRRCCSSPHQPVSPPERTPALRAAEQPPGSPPQRPPAVSLRRGPWGGSGSDMYFTDVLKHMVWMLWMPWKITVTCPNPLPICWHSITFHKLLDTIFPSALLYTQELQAGHKSKQPLYA